MSGRFVRASKYRHVFGRPTKKEQCYDNLRISKNAWDTNLIKANPKYISVNWEASGGGAFAVIPENERGKVPEQIPLFRGHTAPVLDTDWSPFDDSLIASASDDGKVFIWRVPEGFTLYTDGDEVQDVEPLSRLTGHSRKVGHVLFNPSADDVLASSSGDFTIKLWDVEAGMSKLQLKHGDIVQSLCWSANGSLLVTTCRDKKLRIWDVRQEKPAQEVQGHAGAKNSRAVWMGEHDRVATTGFSKMSDRQLGLWDIKAPREPLGGFRLLDSISGVCMPFWDEGTQCLYLAGKGDGNIRYFEYENDKFEYLSEHKSADPQRGVAFLPKRGVNTHENEVVRAYKTVNDTFIEPISFIVPRRAEVFQGDIYPPTVGLKPAMSAKDWFDGQEGLPPKISLESLYEGEEPVEVLSASKPSKANGTSSAQSTTAAKTETEALKIQAPKPEPMPVVAERGPPPSMKENKASMSNIASKFADREESASSDDETSSFEEIPKPVERPNLAARMEEKTRGPEIKMAPPSVSNNQQSQAASPASQSPRIAQNVQSDTKATAVSSDRPASSGAASTASGAAEGIKTYLQDIRSLLEQQSKVMADQSVKISHLTSEVDSLKSRLSDGSGGSQKDERIRQLELELEEARS